MSGSFERWARIDSPADRWLLVFGLLAQGLFLARWIVQWLAAERQRRSHVPVSFWWLSLIGALLTLAYFILRGELVGALSQSVGGVVYVRNLMLIRHGRSAAAEVDA